MNPTLMTGTKIVVLALTAYTIAIVTEQRKHRVTNNVLIFLTLGIVLDVTATIFMIKGSSNTPFTVHGFIGYSSLLGMLIDTFLIWRFRLANGIDAEVPRGLHFYSRYAYSWWVIAFITGGVFAVINY